LTEPPTEERVVPVANTFLYLLCRRKISAAVVFTVTFLLILLLNHDSTAGHTFREDDRALGSFGQAFRDTQRVRGAERAAKTATSADGVDEASVSRGLLLGLGARESLVFFLAQQYSITTITISARRLLSVAPCCLVRGKQ